MKVNTMPTGLADVEGLKTARLVLTNLRGALQAAKDAHEFVKADAERRAVEAMNGSAGKNEEERKRNLVIALYNDGAYQRSLRSLRDAEQAVAHAETDLELAIDQRRAEEWGVRLMLAAAIEHAGVPAEEPGSDESIDEVADEVAVDLHQQYREKRAAWAEQIDKRRAFAEMDEVYGVSF